MKPPVIVLRASGTNRDFEAAYACEMAGGQAEIVHVNQLATGQRRLGDYAMLVLPGGFSYGDDLGAGSLLALDLRYRFRDELACFIEAGKAVLGICNGFQALVKSGFLPGRARAGDLSASSQEPASYRLATLTFNRSARFECRWVYLKPNPASPCVFTRGLDELLYVPVAHGEGRFLVGNAGVSPAHSVSPSGDDLEQLQANGQIALRYVDREGNPVGYPGNPNGSPKGAAGVCNSRGNVFGLMPHPEDHVLPYQHPRWTRGESGGSGLAIFRAGIDYVKNLLGG